MNTELIWETILKGTFWGQGGGVVVFSGMSALDIALWDIKGKALGVPIYQLLGGKCRDELRCYASQLQFGWTTKIGPWGSDKEYVDIVRHAVSEATTREDRLHHLRRERQENPSPVQGRLPRPFAL